MKGHDGQMFSAAMKSTSSSPGTLLDCEPMPRSAQAIGAGLEVRSMPKWKATMRLQHQFVANMAARVSDERDHYQFLVRRTPIFR